MFKNLFPYRWEDSVYDMDFRILYRNGYRNIIFDIDNTLVCHGAPQNDKSLSFLNELKSIGFSFLFISNNKEPRVKSFSEAVGALYIYKAGKPNPRNYIKAVEMLNGTVNNTLFIGDQLFTDIWGANKAGIDSILVKPIDKHEEIQIVLKRRLEWFVLKSYKRYLKRKAFYYVIGNPVKHSKSPLMHNTFAELRGDNLIYNLMPVEENELANLVSTFTKNDVKGFNITVPYKEKIIPFLCGMGDTAKKIGAVNTVKLTKNGYFGINTDVTGLQRSFREENVCIKDKDSVLLGAGGAARGGAAALFFEGAKSIFVINRTYEKAVSFAKNMNDILATDVFSAVNVADFNDLPNHLICLQTTAAGLKGENALITDDSFYEKLDYAMEIVPLKETDFMNRCKNAEVKCTNGFSMLLNQAVDAYEFWNDCTLTKEQIDVVRSKLVNG